MTPTGPKKRTCEQAPSNLEECIHKRRETEALVGRGRIGDPNLQAKDWTDGDVQCSYMGATSRVQFCFLDDRNENVLQEAVDKSCTCQHIWHEMGLKWTELHPGIEPTITWSKDKDVVVIAVADENAWSGIGPFGMSLVRTIRAEMDLLDQITNGGMDLVSEFVIHSEKEQPTDIAKFSQEVWAKVTSGDQSWPVKKEVMADGTTATNSEYEKLPEEEKWRATKFFRLNVIADQSPEPIRATRKHTCLDENERAENAVLGPSAVDFAAAHSVEAANLQMVTVIQAQECKIHRLQVHSSFMANQIEYTQKKVESRTLRIEGFFHNWPSQQVREELLHEMFEICGINARDVVDIDHRERYGNLAPFVIVTFRNDSRKEHLVYENFSWYPKGYKTMDCDSNEIWIQVSPQAASFAKKREEVFRAAIGVVHKWNDDEGGASKIEKFWRPEPRKIEVDGQLAVVVELGAEEQTIEVKIPKVLYKHFQADLGKTMMSKSPIREHREAIQLAKNEDEIEKTVQSYLALFPYQIELVMFSDVAEDKYAQYMQHQELKKWRDSMKGGGKGKGKGKQKGKAKKGKGKMSEANSGGTARTY